MINIIENKELYDNLEAVIKDIFFEVHAIYEPDGQGPYGDCYTAAVDLFREGLTFRIYFKCEEAQDPKIEYAERWYFG